MVPCRWPFGTPNAQTISHLEEIIRKLRTAEEAVAGGRTVEEASLIMTVSMATCQRWKGRYSRREDRYNHRRPH
jgi:transposase